MNSKEYWGLSEAYAEVYAPQEIDEADSLDAMQARREKRLKAQRKREGTTSTGRDFGRDDRLTSDQQKSRRDAEYKAGTRKEEFDIFHNILEHLIDEGYADTEESAIAIMANMSEEWREGILEMMGGAGGMGRMNFSMSRSSGASPRPSGTPTSNRPNTRPTNTNNNNNKERIKLSNPLFSRPSPTIR